MVGEHVADRLAAASERSGSIACVGLDPRPDLIPPPLARRCLERAGGRAAVAEAFGRFGRSILDAVAGACAAVKPQVACYEAYGWEGLRALEETIAHARLLGIPVVVDAKRGDIGSSAVHYRQAWLDRPSGLAGDALPAAGGDWLTANGYLGADALRALLGEPGDGGLFVLVRTSNPGSRDVQELRTAEGSVAEAVARLVHELGRERRGARGFADVGAVVGATWPEEARRLRALMPDAWFLVPGYGAQGAGAADAVAGATADGGGVLVNSSRGIIGAWREHEDHGAERFAEAARAALEAMNADLAAVR